MKPSELKVEFADSDMADASGNAATGSAAASAVGRLEKDAGGMDGKQF